MIANVFVSRGGRHVFFWKHKRLWNSTGPLTVDGVHFSDIGNYRFVPEYSEGGITKAVNQFIG